ncbi:VanZ family protein [Ramlibacter sp. USB13]|uniref:VanZ family protein n=1 Tax=Ramlibacter cellulosilyticus TaxID=2764187 RepID=A0A923SCF9_9BURK|nr:VanZ family protein [Ramlibacter cellulosilyticus]
MKRALPLFRFGLALAIALVAVALLVPYPALVHIQTDVPWLGHTVRWLDSRVPGFDLDHLVAFAAVGFFMALSRLKGGFGLALACFVAAAVLTEFAQLLLPTRSPQLADAAMDVVGGTLGYAVGWVLAAGVSRRMERAGGR